MFLERILGMSNTPINSREDNRLKTARVFVRATQNLIDAEGITNVSIRKIAKSAGFHNSTIYLHFRDLEELVLLASLNFFTDYKKELAEKSKMPGTPKDRFLSIWELFGKTVFSHPQVFYNFFFGKYSKNLTPIITQYYELFPDEKPIYPKEIKEMYYGNNIDDRSYMLLSPLIGTEGLRINDENVFLVNKIIVACFRQILADQCKNPDTDPIASNHFLLMILKYVTGIE